MKEPILKTNKKYLKASREKAKFKILPTDGARAFWQIGQHDRQLGHLHKKELILGNGKVRGKNVFFLQLRRNLIIVLLY